jgi:hypothetical protein
MQDKDTHKALVAYELHKRVQKLADELGFTLSYRTHDGVTRRRDHILIFASDGKEIGLVTDHGDLYNFCMGYKAGRAADQDEVKQEPDMPGGAGGQHPASEYLASAYGSVLMWTCVGAGGGGGNGLVGKIRSALGKFF